MDGTLEGDNMSGGQEASREEDGVDGENTDSLKASLTQIKAWKPADPFLSHVRELADGEMMVKRGNPVRFHYEGLLYRTWRPWGQKKVE